MRPIHILSAVLVMVIWGVNFVAAKVGLYEIPPLMLVGTRFALVALMLVPFVGLPRGAQWWGIALISVVMGSLHFGLMFNGISEIDAGVAAIAIQLQVPFAALLAAIFLDDKLGWRRLAGMALAFFGIVLLTGEPRVGDNLFALFLVIAASLMWAVGNILIKRLGPFDGYTLNAWMAMFTAPQLLVASLVFEPGSVGALLGASWEAWAAILYITVVVTIVAYTLWYHLIPRYDVNQIMPFTLLVPITGVLSGVVLLGEPLTWRVIAGGTITVLGVAIVIIRRPRIFAAEASGD